MVEEDYPAWIDKVTAVAGALGANPTRVRWRLIRWHRRRTHGELQRVDQISHVWSLSTLLGLIMVAVYMRLLAAQGGGMSPSPRVLFAFGSFWPAGASEPWRLVTASLLHVGLWHIGFNLLGLAVVGPQVEQRYGRLTMLFLFAATAVAGNLGSELFQPDVATVGASGGLCGLIGVLAAVGQRSGTTGGRLLRNDMLRWFAFTIVFGFGIGANNYGHAFGALAGAGFGFAVSPRTWKLRALAPLRIVTALAGVAAIIGAAAIIVTRAL